MNDIIIKTSKFIVTKVTDELILKSKLEDKYIFWEEFNEGNCIVWFNTTDYTNKELVDSWNRAKQISVQATDMLLDKLIT